MLLLSRKLRPCGRKWLAQSRSGKCRTMTQAETFWLLSTYSCPSAAFPQKGAELRQCQTSCDPIQYNIRTERAGGGGEMVGVCIEFPVCARGRLHKALQKGYNNLHLWEVETEAHSGENVPQVTQLVGGMARSKSSASFHCPSRPPHSSSDSSSDHTLGQWGQLCTIHP